MKSKPWLFVFFLMSSVHAGEVSSDLLVFVGEFRSIEDYNPPCNSSVGEDVQRICVQIDAGYKVVYEIKELLHGKYNSNIIEFVAFDHYGYPDFAQYKHALLYVSKHGDRFLHEKYQYADVYRTSDGRWAACGDWNQGEGASLPPRQITFRPAVEFDVSRYNEHYAKQAYAAPVYVIDGDKAVCRMGHYAEDLFEIKKRTVLKARDLVTD